MKKYVFKVLVIAGILLICAVLSFSYRVKFEANINSAEAHYTATKHEGKKTGDGAYSFTDRTTTKYGCNEKDCEYCLGGDYESLETPYTANQELYSDTFSSLGWFFAVFSSVLIITALAALVPYNKITRKNNTQK